MALLINKSQNSFNSIFYLNNRPKFTIYFKKILIDFFKFKLNNIDIIKFVLF